MACKSKPYKSRTQVAQSRRFCGRSADLKTCAAPMPNMRSLTYIITSPASQLELFRALCKGLVLSGELALSGRIYNR